MDKKTIEPIGTTFDALTDAMVAPTNYEDLITPDAKERDFLFYSSGGDNGSIKVIIRDEDVWITQIAMADVFGIDKLSLIHI